MKVVVDSGTYRPFDLKMESEQEAKGLMKLLELAMNHIQEGGPGLPTNASQLNTFAQAIRAAVASAAGV